jgi:hypothetical protein
MIWTTAEDICAVPGDSPPENVIWLDPPAPAELGCIGIVFLQRIGHPVAIRGFVPIAALPMKTRQVVLILAARRQMADHEREDLERHRALLAQLPNPTATMRAIVPRGGDESGWHLLDMAVIPSREDI